MSRAWLLALAACGRVGFDAAPRGHADAPPGDGPANPDGSAGLLPSHQYSLNNSYADDYGGPSLGGHGGTFGSDGYDFGPNQGLSVDGALPPAVYTVDLELAFVDLSGWRKILDYEGLTRDSGFYTYDYALQYVIVPGSDFLTAPVTFTANARTRVTLTRDAAGEVVGYLDGAPAMGARSSSAAPPTTVPATPFAFADASGVARLTGTTATFFIDDTATGGGEAATGSVRRIRIYDVPLTAAQVAAMP